MSAEENGTPKVEVKDSFEHVNVLAAEVGKDVKMVGRLDPAFVAKQIQEATRSNLEFRNNILTGLGEEPAIDLIEVDQLLVAAFSKRLDAANVTYADAKSFGLKTPYWMYLKKLVDAP